MSHTLMSLDTEWRRLARASRAPPGAEAVVDPPTPPCAGWRIWTRGTSVRVSAHVFNTADDVDRRLRGAPPVQRVRG